MRRYMGRSWLSVSEAARVIGVGSIDVERMVSDGRLSCIWGCDLGFGCRRRPTARAYVSKCQVEELALRFAALDAAVVGWEEKGC